MKNYIILVTAIVLSACGSNSGESAHVFPAKESAETNLISFKVNGETVSTSGWNISRLTWKDGDKQWLNITTNMHEDKRTIMANLDGAVPGTYVLAEDGGFRASSGSYKPDYIGDMLQSYSFISGSFVLTEVDTVKNKVNGSFSGKVKNKSGEIIEITDGKMENVEMRAGVMHY